MSKQTFTIGMTGTNLVSYLNSNFTELYTGRNVRVANEYGLSTANTAADNVTAMESVVTDGGVIYIKKGTYKVNETIYLESNTVILCEPGTIFEKDDSYCCVFSNEGALTKTWDENIIIDGLEVSVNGRETYNLDVLGLNAHMGFHYIRNLTIRNFVCDDGGTTLYMFYIVNWENVIIDGFRIYSDKDGINLGTGHNALIRNGILQTRDDGGALACVAFPAHTVEVGDVYDVKYENVIDRTGLEVEGGFFCRAITASWDDWKNGNTYQSGDLALNSAGKLYQVQNASFSHVGTVEPVHLSGEETGADTITWKYLNDTAVYKADIYNVTFRNITQTKKRSLLFTNLYVDAAVNLRAVYPGTEDLSTIYNILIDGCNIVHATNIYLIRSDGNLTDVKVVNCTLDNAQLYYNTHTQSFARNLYISFTSNTIKTVGQIITTGMDAEAITIITGGNNAGALYAGINCSNNATIRMIGTDLALRHTHRQSFLTPIVGDIVRDDDGLWVYKAAGWTNLAI